MHKKKSTTSKNSKNNKNIKSDELELLGISDYIKSLFEKNSPLHTRNVRMSKKRARYALRVLNTVADDLNIIMDSPDDDDYFEYQEAITWLKHQVLKKYSFAETFL